VTSDLEEWLDGLGLGQHTDVFADNGVGLDVLPHLSEDDMKELGLNLGDRRRLQAALETPAQTSVPSEDVQQEEPQTRPPEAERRQVTVLFADICGYTKLSNELDAEEMHTILGRFIDRADAIIYDHGGTVDKHVGDSVMAVFGAPIAHSDDSLRAARAAMAIHAAMPVISDEIDRQLQVHIGVASGQVVASGVGDDAHYTVTGDSVNLASRLTDAAAPGETLISVRVQHAIAQAVDSSPRGDLTIKGFGDPVSAYVMQGLREHAAPETETPFVGRQAEIRQFTSALTACTETSTGQVIYIRGEAGIGKTRITEEIVRIATEQGFDCHRTLVLDFGVGKGQGAIHALVRSLLAIPSGSGKAVRNDAAERMFATGILDRRQAMYLNDFLDLPQPPELRSLYEAMDNEVRNEGKRETLATLVRAQSEQRSTLLIVEDLHWADSLVVAQLADLTQSITDARAILVMTSRIEGDPLNQTWRLSTTATPLMTVDLRPLRQDDAMQLAAGFIDINNQFAINCIERAGGNPLFLDQLLRSAEERGDEGVPDSVQSVIQARIDSLDDPDKQALLAASVLGQRFSLDALRHLIANPQYGPDNLMSHDLIRPEGGDYLFVHALVKEGVYTSLLKTRRTALHRKAAEWYAPHDLALSAEHLDRAEDPTAAASYQQAAEAEAAKLHLETALQLTDRGLELVTDPATRYALLCLRADVLRDMGATAQSITAFETAVEAAPDDITRCNAWIGVAKGLRIADRQTEALEILDKAQKVATDHDLASEQAQIHYLRGNVYFPLGNIDGCLEEHGKSLRFAQAAGSAEDEALASGGLGDGYYLRGHMQSACERFRACVERCREHGYGRIEVANRHMVGWSRIYLMEFEEAREDGLAAAAMAAKISHHRAEMLGLLLAARTELEMGEYVDVRNHLDRSLDLSRRMSAGNFEAQSLMQLGRLSAAQGEMAEAQQWANEAVSVARNVGLTFIGPSALAQQAAFTEDAAERREILKEGEDILESGCVAHNLFWHSFTAMDLALTAHDWDDVERYAKRLEMFTHAQPLAWSDFMIARGRALSAWGQGSREKGVEMELKRLRDIAVAVNLKPALIDLEGALATPRAM
jgi:class 3 adenylate cyclase/tetratricopeptide (TPR) repeat protein